MTQQGQADVVTSSNTQGWRDMASAPKDGTHIIGNTQWGAREIWWHKDAYEGEYWTDEGDSEPEPTGWIPKPGDAPSAPGSVPTSLAGQVPDAAPQPGTIPEQAGKSVPEKGNKFPGSERSVSASQVPDGYAKALQEISTLAAQFDDEREAGYIVVAKLGRIAREAIIAGATAPDQDKDLRERYFEARDALYQFNYPPDPKLLREIADEIDCGTDCDHCHTEWDTNAHICSRTESQEGCASEKANCLREFAKAVEVRAALQSSPQPTAGGDAPRPVAKAAHEIAVRYRPAESELPFSPHSSAVWQSSLEDAISDALSAERARVIAQCIEIVHAKQIEFHSDACGYAIDALRALGQQDTREMEVGIVPR